ncbi:hypothetical protein [Sphingomonas nostoxanthinifaciens]|uniref:hypothetical protein n=1 Tax=Sphingomonas nostoxanthinifaciens TaxID=2872652 RepID=UPI001CC210E8|nr:hypothetical protein [Sphingomonas nostoxanthinifaciens]UAK24275.1 hypothetical protein K8P63_18440 [Sphingomonas nostoxanthinifaciens]
MAMRLAVLIGLMVPGIAHAAGPTYLACTIDTATGPVAINLTVDDVSRSVFYEAPATGFASRRSATFLPDKIVFEVPLTVGAAEFAVSRTDLTITRTVTANRTPGVDQGKCTRQKPAKRAF